MTYEKWYDAKATINSAMHLIINDNFAVIEHYHFSIKDSKKIKKDVYGDMTEENAIRWLRDRGWLGHQVMRKPSWIKLEGDVITGHPMVIGEL